MIKTFVKIRILLILVLIGVLTGCGYTPDPNGTTVPTAEESSKELISSAMSECGVRAYIPEYILAPGCYWLNVVYENPTEDEFTFGLGYSIEKKSEGEWTAIPFNEDYLDYLEECRLETHDLGTIRYPLDVFEEELTPGTYRITGTPLRKTSQLSEEENENTEYSALSLEFMIDMTADASENQEDGSEQEVHYPEKMSVTRYNDIMESGILPELSEEWQWYTFGDVEALIRHRGDQIYQFSYGADGLIAVLYQDADPPEVDNIDDFTMFLGIFDGKTGDLYNVGDDARFHYDAVSANDEGFTARTDDGYIRIELDDGSLITVEMK